jgi:hypothetical protein
VDEHVVRAGQRAHQVDDPGIQMQKVLDLDGLEPQSAEQGLEGG